MAGERYSKQIIQINDPRAGLWIEIYMGSIWHRFTPVTSPATPQEFAFGSGGATQAINKRFTALNFIAAINRVIDDLALTYRVTDTHNSFLATTDVIIEATFYSNATDFLPIRQAPTNLSGFRFLEMGREDAITPIYLNAVPTHVTRFGSADGAIDLGVSRAGFADPATYTYAWDDGPTSQNRTGLTAGTYRVTVTDDRGASASLSVVINQDQRLTVIVERQDNNARLVTSGGIIPYSYAWNDGVTTSERRALGAGVYSCLITDARGASTQISFTIALLQCYFSQNPILLPLDAGDAYRADPRTKPNLSFLCEVWVEPVYLSGDFVRIGQALEQPADRAGRTEFQVETLLDAYLQEHLPRLNQLYLERADSLFKRFYLKSSERFGEPPVESAFEDQQLHYVVLGGLDFYEQAAQTWFSSYQQAVKPFLTWQPNDKLATADQPEYLYFRVEASVSEMRLLVRVHFADSTSVLGLYGTVPEPRRFEVYCLPVGFYPLNLQRFHEYAIGQVVGWDVYMGDANEVPISEVRRFRLDTSYYPQKRYFLYTNSLGGVDTVLLDGDGKRTITPTQDEAERPADPHYDPTLGDAVVLDRSATNVLNVSTRVPSRAALISLQELVLSRRVTMQKDGLYWPGKVKPKAYEADNDAETVRTFEFDFELPRLRHVTPRLPVVAAGQVIKPVSAGEGAQP